MTARSGDWSKSEIMAALKEIARQLFLATLERIDPQRLIAERVKLRGDYLAIADERINLNDYERVFVIAFGKASLKMSVALEALLGDRLQAGVVATNALLDDVKPERLEVIVGGHPYPTEGSLRAARRAVTLARQADERTLLIFLVSGGGSSLIESPVADTISLADLRELNRLLVTCGARIREMNAVRKHLSAIKGGRLAALAPRARKLTLYISDVNRDDLATIASDPTGPDDTTLAEFYATIEGYELMPRLPASIAALVQARRITETAHADHSAFQASQRFLLMDNQEMLAIAAELAVESGWLTVVDPSNNEEHYATVADRLLNQLSSLCREHAHQPVCLVTGGEVSCPVRGRGTGGRNQELALYGATQLETFLPQYEVAILSAGSDGIDGNSQAAGAVVDQETLARAAAQGLAATEFLANNDATNFFAPLGDLLVTGPTGTNVRDLRLLLARPVS